MTKIGCFYPARLATGGGVDSLRQRQPHPPLAPGSYPRVHTLFGPTQTAVSPRLQLHLDITRIHSPYRLFCLLAFASLPLLPPSTIIPRLCRPFHLRFSLFRLDGNVILHHIHLIQPYRTTSLDNPRITRSDDRLTPSYSRHVYQKGAFAPWFIRRVIRSFECPGGGKPSRGHPLES